MPEITTATPAEPPGLTKEPTEVPEMSPAATSTSEATAATTIAAISPTEAPPLVDEPVQRVSSASKPTASPTRVPSTELSENPMGKPGTMLPKEAPPKMSPAPTIIARTSMLNEMVGE